MATYYGGWVATDDYRAVLEVSTGSGDGKTTYTITGAVKIQSLYGYASWGVSANLKVAGSQKASVSDRSMPSGTTTSLIGNTSTTINRTHSAQSISVSGTVAADGTPYYGASSTASATVTVPAKASYSVTYNANGGSGAPSSQTKWHGETLTLSTTKPTRSGYTFLGWSTSSTATSATYAAGGSYTANSAATLYAVWKAITYSVTYNANGGSGAPGTQTKTYGVTLKLSSTKPTRTGYTFQGWATSSTGSVAYAAGADYTANAALALYAVWKANTYAITYNANKPSAASGSVTSMPASQTKTYGMTLKLSTTKPVLTNYSFQGWATSASGSVAYAAGANYTDNQARTLYAVWVLTYVAPTLTNLTAIRCDSDGTPNDEGTYCKLTLTWTNGNYAPTKVVFKVGSTSQTVTVTSGTTSATKVMGTFSVEQRFTVAATLTDAASKSYTRSTILTPSFFTLDFLSGGKGIAIGQAASEDGLHIAMATTHENASIFAKAMNIDRDGANPSAATWSTSELDFLDKDDERVGFLNMKQNTDGSMELVLSAQAESTAGANVYNSINLIAKRDGTRGYAVSDAAAFRNAVNVVGATNQSTQNVLISNFIGEAQLFGLTANCINANSTLNGKRLSLIFRNDGLSGWNNSDSSQMWSIALPTGTVNFRNVFTSTVAQVITAASGFTISQASYVQNGRMGQWYMTVKNTNAMSANTQYTIGTIVSGKRPATWSPVEFGDTSNTYGNGRVTAGGNVLVRPSASIAAGTTFFLLCPAYILG